jgi:preprotein translocase subunit SecG
MQTLVTVIHLLVALVLVVTVLLQRGKGAGMGMAFGGGGGGGGASSTVFGSSGAGGFLAKLTAWTAVAFMVTSLSLAYMSGRGGTSIMRGSSPAAVPAAVEPAPVAEEEAAPVEEAAPAEEAAPVQEAQ